MTNEKTDRRVERTRRSLHQALMALILEKRYDKITVQNIIDRADVGRATFYAHFLDKDDLLVQALAMFSDALNAHLAAPEHEGEDGEHVLHSLTFFRHAEQHHDLYKAMQEGGGLEIIMDAGRRHLTEDICAHLSERFGAEIPSAIPLPVITDFLAGAMLSVLMGWLDAGRPVPPEAINATFQQLAMDGVESLLHAVEGSP